MIPKENVALYAFQHFGDTVLQAAYCCIGNMSDAEDAAQEVFFSLHRTPQSFNDDEHLKAWLLRSVINRCKNMKKSIWRRMRASFEDIPESALADATDNTGEILSMIQALPQPYAEVVYLHDYEGYSTSEIAELLGRPANTVSTQLARGHIKLRMELSEEEAAQWT